MPRKPTTKDISGQLLLLGTGTSMGVPVIGCDCPTCLSSDPRNRRTRCGLALGLPEGVLLVDTPPDLHAQLLREGIGLAHAVLFTHPHADHLFGLDDVRLFPYYLGHRLPVYCEADVEQRIRHTFDYAFSPESEQFPAGGVPQLEIRPIDLSPFEVLGQSVVPIRLLHGRMNVLGFRFGNVAYCTDVNHIPEESFERLAGLDVLILDALRPQPHPTHFSLGQALAVAERIGARRTLLTHLSHQLEHESTSAALPPGVELAFDGLAVPLS